MTYSMLSGPELPPLSGKPPSQLILLLHGLGADGNDLLGLAPEFAEALPHAHFMSPHAPYPCDMAPFGYQWFSYRDQRLEILPSLASETIPILDHFVNAQLARFQLLPEQLAFIGFSQGAMISLHYGLVHRKPCRAILGYSGGMVGVPSLLSPTQTNPEVCLVHGDMDMVVPFGAMERTKAALGAHGVPVEAHRRPWLGHSIDPEGIRIGQRFLQRVFE